MKITGNESVNSFACTENIPSAVGQGYVGQRTVIKGGLTIRQHFAAMAMQGLLAASEKGDVQDEAVVAVAYADALIVELNKEKP